MTKLQHLKYATRVAELIPQDPNKWIPIWAKHMQLSIRGAK